MRITDVEKHLPKEFVPLIKYDNDSGKILGLHHMQDHHIIHKAQPEHQEIFKRAGLSIDDHIDGNRILLPDKTGAEIYPSTRSIHHGAHTDSSAEIFNKEIIDFLKEGDQLKYSQEKYQEKLREIMARERGELLKGKSLNKHTREL